MKSCTEIMKKKDVTFFSCNKEIISNIWKDQTAVEDSDASQKLLRKVNERGRGDSVE